MKFVDIVGRKFGKLLVLSKVENKGKNTAFLCRCDCGKEKSILTCNLLSGKSASCGCIRGVKLGNFARTHNLSKTRIYRIYKGMKQRCLNKKNPAYKYYGGRGIVICKEWLNDFKLFHKWAEKNHYSELMTIDRINSDGNYEPSNCRWVSYHKQQNNKRNSFFITVDGEKLTVAEWAEKKKTKQQTLYDKFYRILEQLDLEKNNIVEISIKTIKKGLVYKCL